MPLIRDQDERTCEIVEGFRVLLEMPGIAGGLRPGPWADYRCAILRIVRRELPETPAGGVS